MVNGAEPRPETTPQVDVMLGGLDDTHQWAKPIRGVSPVPLE